MVKQYRRDENGFRARLYQGDQLFHVSRISRIKPFETMRKCRTGGMSHVL
jgi:hypothetical protein